GCIASLRGKRYCCRLSFGPRSKCECARPGELYVFAHGRASIAGRTFPLVECSELGRPRGGDAVCGYLPCCQFALCADRNGSRIASLRGQEWCSSDPAGNPSAPTKVWRGSRMQLKEIISALLLSITAIAAPGPLAQAQTQQSESSVQ